MRELPGPEDRYDVLVMLDEFRQLQRMDAIVEKIPISAGYGFRMAIVIQNMSQLDEIYGKATREGIVANCALKLFVALDDLATANYVSDQLGNRTVTTTTTNFRRGGPLLGEHSVSKSLTGVPLMRADEVIRLPKQNSILMIANERPILTKKIRYDRDRLFRRLAGIGKSTFRTVPDVPTLDEFRLAILTADYGKAPSQLTEKVAVPGEGATPPAETPTPPGLRVASSEAERARLGQARTQPKFTEGPSLITPTAAETWVAMAVRDASTPATEHEQPSQEEAFDKARAGLAPAVKPNNLGARFKMAGGPPVAAARVDKKVKLETTACAKQEPAVFELRSTRRQKDTLSSMFGVDSMADIHQEVRAGSDPMSRIGEMVRRKANTATDPATRSEALALIVELDHAATASRVTDSGELKGAD